MEEEESERKEEVENLQEVIKSIRYDYIVI